GDDCDRQSHYRRTYRFRSRLESHGVQSRQRRRRLERQAGPLEPGQRGEWIVVVPHFAVFTVVAALGQRLRLEVRLYKAWRAARMPLRSAPATVPASSLSVASPARKIVSPIGIASSSRAPLPSTST